MNTALSIFCILSFCACSRVFFLMQNATDSWLTYLLLATNRSKPSLDLSMPNSILDNAQMPYPPLIHFLASRGSEKFEKIVAQIISVGSDAATGVALYVGLLYFLPTVGGSDDSVQGYALVSTLAFLCLPILLPVTARIKAANGRPLGLLLCTVFYVIVLFSLNYSARVLVLAILAVYLIVVASKFALQVIFFVTPVLSVLVWSWYPLIPLGFILAHVVCLPKSSVAMLCRDKISHALRYKIAGSTAEHRNIIRNFFFFTSLGRDYGKSCSLLRRTSPLLIALYSIPYALFVLVAPVVLPDGQSVWSDSVLTYCHHLTLAATLVFLATSTGPLRVFGQSERYFEYVAPWVMLFTAGMMFKFGDPEMVWPVFMLALNILLTAFLHIGTDMSVLRRLGSFHFEGDEDLVQVHDYLSQRGECRAAPVPIKLSYIFMGLAFKEGMEGLRYYHPTMSSYPVPLDNYKEKKELFENPFVFRNSPQWVKRRLGIDVIIEDTTFTQQCMDMDFVVELHKLEPNFVVGRLNVYHI